MNGRVIIFILLSIPELAKQPPPALCPIPNPYPNFDTIVVPVHPESQLKNGWHDLHMQSKHALGD